MTGTDDDKMLGSGGGSPVKEKELLASWLGDGCVHFNGSNGEEELAPHSEEDTASSGSVAAPIIDAPRGVSGGIFSSLLALTLLLLSSLMLLSLQILGTTGVLLRTDSYALRETRDDDVDGSLVATVRRAILW